MKELYVKLTKGNKQILIQQIYISFQYFHLFYVETGHTDMQQVYYSPNNSFFLNVNECECLHHHHHRNHTEV